MSSFSGRWQRTLERGISLAGIGVHSATPVSVTLRPAEPDSGIRFLRTGLPNSPDVEIPARWSAVSATELCTVLGDPHKGSVATVEHLLAALAGLGVDNVIVEIDGPEVPVMDGSAAMFVEAIDKVGTRSQEAPRRWLRIDKPVRVEMGAAYAEFRPHPRPRFDIAIDYDCTVVGRQQISLELTPAVFRRTVARARTFGYLRDVERLWAAGFALGSSLENSVVIGADAILNPEGLRYPDEFVRHKVLDTIGDLALAGNPIRGLYTSYRGGHRLNALALSTLLARSDAWSLVTDPEREPRAEPRAELAQRLLSPAFVPEAL